MTKCDIGQHLMLQWRSRFQPLSKHSFEPIRCCVLSLGADMRRREFLGVLGGAAARGRSRRARSSRADAADRRAHGLGRGRCGIAARIAAFLQGLQQLGWTDGRNVRIDTRWATTNADDIRRHAAELVALAPDVLLAGTGTATVAPLLQATRTVPIVFVVVIDPVGAGFVASLARPGGNATGFTFSNTA